jgi:type I restriction enzyme S subunit
MKSLMPNIDLNQLDWSQVARILQERVPEFDVWAFGSRVKWTAKSHSDLDLAIITDKPLSLARFAEIREDFDESVLPFRVDIVDWAATSDTFRRIIERDKLVLQTGKNAQSLAVQFPVYPLDSCLDALIDYRGKTPEKTNAGIPLVTAKVIKGGRIEAPTEFISPADYDSWMRRGIPAAGDVVMTTEAPLGEVAQLGAEKVALAQRVITLRGKTGILDNTYLLYLLQTEEMQEQLRARATGTTVLGIKQSELRKISVRLPPLNLQVSASSTLKALDDRITLLRETNATLEAIAQTLFKSWFVDFDPVHAKQQGLAPEGMDDATAELFPDGFEESELGMVPKGWRLLPFGELLTRTIGGDWGSDVPDDKNDSRVAIIRGTDIPDLQTGASSRVPIRYTSQKKLSTRRLEDGDIVLEVSGGSKDQPTGRALYLTDRMLCQFDCPVEPASFCRLLRPTTKDVGVLLGQHLTYIYAQGKTWEYQNQSTGIANFQTSHFLETELVVVPPQNVLAAFAEIVRLMIDRTHLTQVQQLAALRDTLLPRLISGQLRLPEAETILEEAAA